MNQIAEFILISIMFAFSSCDYGDIAELVKPDGLKVNYNYTGGGVSSTNQIYIEISDQPFDNYPFTVTVYTSKSEDTASGSVLFSKSELGDLSPVYLRAVYDLDMSYSVNSGDYYINYDSQSTTSIPITVGEGITVNITFGTVYALQI